jgi:hypothetical protein
MPLQTMIVKYIAPQSLQVENNITKFMTNPNMQTKG